MDVRFEKSEKQSAIVFPKEEEGEQEDADGKIKIKVNYKNLEEEEKLNSPFEFGGDENHEQPFEYSKTSISEQICMTEIEDESYDADHSKQFINDGIKVRVSINK